jgi:hypothetical protein
MNTTEKKIANWNLGRVITDVNCKFGAPMGRSKVGQAPQNIKAGRKNRFYTSAGVPIYTKRVQLDCGGYDKGGAYWGLGGDLYVRFTADLLYIEFYRVNQVY